MKKLESISAEKVVYCPLITSELKGMPKMKMFICSIRKLLEFECLLLFFAWCPFHLKNKKKKTSFLLAIKTCTWFLLVACNDGQFFWDLFFSMEFSLIMKTFNNIFVVSLFFFSDDRFISKYLSSLPTTPEPRLSESYFEGHNLLHFVLVSFTKSVT